MALAVGAIKNTSRFRVQVSALSCRLYIVNLGPRESCSQLSLSSSGSVPVPAPISSNLYARASTVAWVENVLGVEYPPMIADPKRYIVPPPLNLPGNVTAR